MLVVGLGYAASSAAQPVIDGCPIFPADNVWNTPVANLPVAADSATLIQNMNPNAGLHPDFGSGLWAGGRIGIPFDSVPVDQPPVPVDFATFGWPDESDPGPYPIPPDPQIEGEPSNATGDRHVLVVERGDCVLWETFYTYPHGENGCDNEGGWCAASGATWSLASNALRPEGWTAADAAGLPILPGLVRYEEVAAGEIRHALRFTAAPTRQAWVWPARHQAGSTTDPAAPPMGLRLRLKAGFDHSGFSAQTRIVLVALQRYGMILADNGSDWYLSGAPHESWNNDQLVAELAQVHGSDFEVVDTTSLLLSLDSAATPHLFSAGFEAGVAAFGYWSAIVIDPP